MQQDRSDLRKAMHRTTQMPDERSLGVYKLINEIYPALAEKIFQGNKLMKSLIMGGMNPMDIMEYPVCGKCESFAAYCDPVKKDGKLVKACACVRKGCGAVTPNPVEFREWLLYELKKKADPKVLAQFDTVVDRIAMNMALTAQAELLREIEMVREKQRQQMQATNPDFEIKTYVADPEIEHHGQMKPELEKDIEEIKEDLGDV